MLNRMTLSLLCLPLAAACASEDGIKPVPLVTFDGREGDVYAFQATPLGETTSAYLRVTNPTSSAITLSHIDISGSETQAFLLSRALGQVSIGARNSRDFEILFHPEAVGLQESMLTLHFLEADPISIRLQGEGLALVSSGLKVLVDNQVPGSTFIFPYVSEVGPQSVQLTLVNESEGPLNLSDYTITTLSPSNTFSLGGFIQTLLEPGDTIQVPLGFYPRSCGFYEGKLTVQTATQTELDLTLRGALLRATEVELATSTQAMTLRSTADGYQLLLGQGHQPIGGLQSVSFNGCSAAPPIELSASSLGVGSASLGSQVLWVAGEDRLLVTAPAEKGHAYFLIPQGQDGWTYDSELLTNESGRALGYSAAWSGNGDVIVLAQASNNAQSSGSLLLYERLEMWKGLPDASLKLKTTQGGVNPSFGNALAISHSGDLIAATSHCPDQREGCVFLWDFKDGTWGQIAPVAEPHHRFESAVLDNPGWLHSGSPILAMSRDGVLIANALQSSQEFALHQEPAAGWGATLAPFTRVSTDAPILSLAFDRLEDRLFVGTAQATFLYRIQRNSLPPEVTLEETWPLGGHALTLSADGHLIVGHDATKVWMNPL